MKRINIGKDFSDTPWGRYPEDGPVSGERFREELLKPALQAERKVCVEIDDAEGYGSSFLDEAFGGLVRKHYFTSRELKEQLTIKCDDPDYLIYRDLIWKYINESKPE